MIYVYCNRSSNGARDLSQAVNGRRIRVFENGQFAISQRIAVRQPTAQDLVVMWGSRIPNVPNGLRVLNNGPMLNKFEAARRLTEARVPTVEVSLTRPQVQPTRVVPQVLNINGGPLTKEQIRVMLPRLQEFLNTPDPVPVPAATWLARSFTHVGGNDLLHTPAHPEYYSKKEDLDREYRIHCFKGKSIRAGVKGPREGARQHEWIRSWDGGWSINYDGFESTQEMRVLAASALEALELDFGAVDIARKRGGGLIVLEVNRAPGLEGNTITAYADAIERHLNPPARRRARA